MKKFLTAEWRDLVIANYKVDRAVLADRIPHGTEFDLFDGNCFVSLVGFMFLNTRVLDFLVPFHVNFEEVNLRFYVCRETDDEIRRGVVFVKEIVPKAAIALVARRLYGEPYECWTMTNQRDEKTAGYSWQRGATKNSISVGRGKNLGVPAEGSHGRFIIEHYWGYTKRGETRTDEYNVEHPRWELFETENVHIDVDFGNTYGQDFEFLNSEVPYSVLLAKGSEIAVYKGARISIQDPVKP